MEEHLRRDLVNPPGLLGLKSSEVSQIPLELRRELRIEAL